MKLYEWALLVIAFVCAIASVFVAQGCATVPPGFSPIAPRVLEREGYGRCIEAGGKLEHEGTTVALLSSVCVMMDAGSSSGPARESSSSSPADASSSELEGKDASSSELEEGGSL